MDIITTVMVGVFVFMCLYLFWLWFCFGGFMKRRQKTRNPQQRRAYVGSRSQTSNTASEPTIYVSPANLPPPPKYESMAPPSYEEVVGIHYPGYQPPGQPINQPITAALASHSNTSTTNTSSVANDSSNATNVSHTVVNSVTTITTVDERRPATVPVVSS